MTPSGPAASRKAAIKFAEGAIYKTLPMNKVARMGKRFFNFGAGLVLGAVLSVSAGCLAVAWSIFPNRDLSHAAAYVKEVLQIVNEHYVDPAAADYDSLARSAIHGMVESLDPHSEFLESKDNAELEEDLSGEFGGIGIQVEVHGGRAVVVAPMRDTPSQRAGILRGDEIISIDGRALGSGVSMDEIVDHLRGKPHTQVALGLFRPSTGQHLNLTLTREIIKVDSIGETRVLADGIGYIQITEFSEHTGDQFIDALNRLLKQDIGGLILDLRDNPGGLLDSAVDVSEPFFKKGELIVYTQGRTPSDREEYRAESDEQPLDMPVAVLINSGTASAAEIVTAALKDTGRAVVVGERSFGKGSVQSIFKLRNGDGLRLTTARYYTPSGISIHQRGVAPQVEVVMTADEDAKLQQQHSRPDISDPAEFKRLFGFEPIEDRQLDAALDVLRGVLLLDSQQKK
jgi:carboxyl-terminal processing protease